MVLKFVYSQNSFFLTLFWNRDFFLTFPSSFSLWSARFWRTLWDQWICWNDVECWWLSWLFVEDWGHSGIWWCFLWSSKLSCNMLQLSNISLSFSLYTSSHYLNEVLFTLHFFQYFSQFASWDFSITTSYFHEKLMCFFLFLWRLALSMMYAYVIRCSLLFSFINEIIMVFVDVLEDPINLIVNWWIVHEFGSLFDFNSWSCDA